VYDLNDHRSFVQAVDHGGFAAAARALGIPKSTISRRVLALESRLGVRLIERTSRRFVPTAVGLDFYQHARAMLIEAEAAESIVARHMAEPSGILRMTCSVGMARSLSAPLVDFLGRHPKLRLVQFATNKYVDLIEEGFDVGIRGHGGPLPDSTLIQRRLADSPWHVFAAPAYLERAGIPEHPSELTSHETVALGSNTRSPSWQFFREDEQLTVSIEPKLQSSDMETMRDAAVAAHGIVSLPAYVVQEEVAAGSLVRVLPRWITQKAQISLLTPPLRSRLPSVRALIDFLVEAYPRVVG
jgi:DNA-binding transcriptional LysR family regulator